LNQTAPRFLTHELDQNQCIHGRTQEFFPGGKSRNLFRLPTMSCKWTFTKRYTLSTH